jgi:hypothetical protein
VSCSLQNPFKGEKRYVMFRSSSIRVLLVAVFAVLISSQSLFGQAGRTGALRGKVTDPTGAVIPGVVITAKSADGQMLTTTSGGDGSYQFKEMLPGQYTLTISAQGFAPYTKTGVIVAAGRAQALDLPLQIEVVEQKIDVQDQGNTVDTASANNSNTVVLRGKDLDALSDDPDELQNELQALAGPSAGPNGGQMYIDGFTGGQLPPKSAIREIRINQNPFSAQYDKLGMGRIEIFTKPGTDKYHGQLEFNENNAIFNARNPFISNKPDYHTEQIEGNVGGPAGKKASFFLSGQTRRIGDVGVVSPRCGTFVLPECAQTSVSNPRTRTNISPRFDYQVSASNTLTTRYQFFDQSEQNDGIGQTTNRINLPSLGYNLDSTEHTVQIADTQIFGAKLVNETRFQYLRDHSEQIPLSTAPELSVAGIFGAGGNSSGHVVSGGDHYEFQNYTSVVFGNHSARFGGRLRVNNVSDQNFSNFNGTFSYPSLSAFVNNQPNQFTIAHGVPLITNSYVDAGLYAEDDWKARPNLTVSYGLRFETQNDIHDHSDFAPRVGVAWGVGKKGSTPKTVVRAGFGIFYDRFTQNLVLQAERLNGSNEQLFVVSNPNFGPSNIPSSFAGFTGRPSTVYRIDPNLRAPYLMQTAVGVEHQLTKAAKLSLTYINSRGLHQLFTNNINAPLPGTFPGNSVCPLGCSVGNIYEYQSEGIFKQNQLITNLNMRVSTAVSLFGFYSLSYANSDTSGSGSFPTNPYNPSADYGRAGFDVRNRLFIGGSFQVPYGLRLSPFIIASSGQPYNITIPEDLSGTSIFNARPGLAVGSPGCPALSTTNASCFFIPAVGQAYTPIPINYGQGPAYFSVNLRVAKSFGLGPLLERAGGGQRPGGGGGGDRREGGFGGFGGGEGMRGMFGGRPNNHRYNLTFSAQAFNLFNRENLSVPVGVLSPQGNSDFGQSLSLAGIGGPGSGGGGSSQAANRRISLQVQFSF